MSIAKKIAWRVDVLIKAFRMGRATDWPGVLTHPPPVLLDTDGDLGLYQVGDHKVWFSLSFNPSFLSFVYHEIFVQKVYEYGECRVLPGDWVVDAGACEGFFSLYALEKGANVLAFEPVLEIAQALERTLEPFIQKGRAGVFPVGLGKGREGDNDLSFSFINSGSHTMSGDLYKIRGESYEHRTPGKSICCSPRLPLCSKSSLLLFPFPSKPLWRVTSGSSFWKHRKPSGDISRAFLFAPITFPMTGR